MTRRPTPALDLYQALFEASPDGLLLIDPASMRAIEFNDAACRQLGYTREEFRRLAVSDYEADQSEADVRALVKRILAEGALEFETKHRSKDGAVRSVRIFARSITFDGRVCFFVIYRDIEKQLEAEAQLHRLNQLLTLTARLAKIGGWEYDVRTEHLTWTSEVFVLHEIDPPVQPSVAEAVAFYAPEARSVISAAVQTAIAIGTPFDLELPLITARGRHLWVRALGSCEQLHGRTTRVYGTIQDITERRNLDERSRLESAALSAAANAVVITDRAGIIRSVNTAFTRLTGYTEAEAVGRQPGELLKSGVHDQAFFQRFWDTILSGRVWRGEMTNRRKGGSLYAEEMVVTPVTDASGAITHFVAIKEDLSQRQELERQLRHAQKMEAVGQLAGGIAHDFNNLLTVILSYAAFARTALPAGDPIRADVQEIESTARRAADLTSQLLTFGRRSAVTPRALDLNAVVKGAYPLLRRSIGEDVELVTVLGDGLGTVMADPVQMEQVLVNMAVNARDAMPAGGTLTIETANRVLDAAYASRHVLVPPGDYVVLSISDTGTGLSPEAEEHLFEPFFTTKLTGKGTGLGLATCFGIVRQGNGWIIPYSEPGSGMTFKVLLPRIMAEAEAHAEPVHAAVYGGGTETVLVVEDSRDVRRLAVRTLSSLGYRVLEASAGDEALRLSAEFQGHIDVLATDIVMPGMRGSELADRLRATRPGLKTLYMSGYTADTQSDLSRLDAGSAFLPKPFVSDDLACTVRALIDRTASGQAAQR